MADKTQEEIETAPDPEEDDLDDLDDVLDEFDSKPKLPSEPKPSASGPGRPPQTQSLVPEYAALEEEEGEGEGEGEEDLAAQLQAGMGNLIAELGENPEMQKQFEAMMQELIAADNAGGDAGASESVKRAADSMPQAEKSSKATASAGAAAGSKKEESFQSTIRKTMERMQQSGDAATAAASSSSVSGGDKDKSEEEMLLEMMKSMGMGTGESGEEDFNNMLLNMMTQLVNKEILYEPMKELDEKFPPWMERNKDSNSVTRDDWRRYEEQQRLVREIVQRFEREGYRDENEEDREFIVERMQKMQEAGSPPPDLVGDMSAAQEALGELDQGCPTQ